MTKQPNHSRDDSLRTEFQQLVTELGLSRGKLSFKVHEGLVTVFEIYPAYILQCGEPDFSSTAPWVESIRLTRAKRFVRRRLELKIYRKIGLYGHVRVTVEDGLVVDSLFSHRHKY